jgi:hypothetical protein
MELSNIAQLQNYIIGCESTVVPCLFDYTGREKTVLFGFGIPNQNGRQGTLEPKKALAYRSAYFFKIASI